MIKKVWTRLKGMQPGPLVRLLFLLLLHPFRIKPTMRSSKETMALCDKLYGNTHHRTNKANAFRHAYWNYKMAKNCQKTVKNTQKAAKWAQKVTDLYEDVSINKPLERAMDLHNNKIGIEVFLNKIEQKEDEIVLFLKEMAQNALKFDQLEFLRNHPDQMVYLTDDPA